MSLRTPLARAKGLGSAKEGASHWWLQRMTAIALVPLSLWFVISLVSVVGADYIAVVEWVSSPVQSALLILFLATTFYHAQLGLQVVIEDYVGGEGAKLAVLIAMKLIMLFLAAVSILAVLRIAFGG